MVFTFSVIISNVIASELVQGETFQWLLSFHIFNKCMHMQFISCLQIWKKQSFTKQNQNRKRKTTAFCPTRTFSVAFLTNLTEVCDIRGGSGAGLCIESGLPGTGGSVSQWVVSALLVCWHGYGSIETEWILFCALPLRYIIIDHYEEKKKKYNTERI